MIINKIILIGNIFNQILNMNGTKIYKFLIIKNKKFNKNNIF